jgi:hypothetical protein
MDDDGGIAPTLIDGIVDAIALPAKPDAAILALAQSRATKDAPRYIKAIADAAAGRPICEADENLIFYGLHILGAARVQMAFQPLLRLLRLPDEDLDYLLGDIITETLPLIAAGTFDGDTAGMIAMIADGTVDPFVRASLLRAFAFLTWDGRIPQEEARAFLTRFDDDNLGASDKAGITWEAWQMSVGLLGWRDFTPRVKAAFRDRRIPEDVAIFEDFLTDLIQAETDPAGYARWRRLNLGYIDDIAESLAWVPDGDEDTGLDDDPPPITPVTNPYRNVGRNDPCPCGSGKKFKKCCLPQ